MLSRQLRSLIPDLRTCAVALFVLVLAQAAGATALAKEITARDLLAIVDIDGLSVSPDGRWAALQTRVADPNDNTYMLAWNVVPIEGGPARRVADAGDPLLVAALGRTIGAIRAAAPVWAPDGRSIVYLRRDNGRTQVWQADIDARSSQQLTQGEGDACAIAYSADGSRILFQVEPSRMQIESALAREGRHGFLYDKRFFPSYSTAPLLPADVDFAVAKGQSSKQMERPVFAYEIENRRTRLATSTEAAEFARATNSNAARVPKAAHGETAISFSGSRVWTEARDPQRRGGMPPLTVVAQLNETTTPTVCSAVACTGQSISGVWWRNEDEVVFARDEGTRLQDHALYAWHLSEAGPRLLLRTPNVFNSQEVSKCALALDQLVCFYEEPDHPRRLVAIDLKTGRVRVLFDPNPNFKLFDLGSAPKRLDFRAPSGVLNYGYLVVPSRRRAGERLPLVIVTYRCGGFLRGGLGDEYPVFPLVAQGFAVLCFNAPDVDYDRIAVMDWASYSNWARGPGDPEKRRVQEALETAVAELDRMGIIDPNKVGLTGLSFGAETAMYALFNMPRLAATIASGTEINPSSNFLYGPAGGDLLAAWGLDEFSSPRWDALSLTRNADRVRAPLLLNLPDHEMLNALYPYEALQKANKPVEVFVFPNEYHIKWQPAHRHAIYNRNIDWMNFWLRGLEDSDPSKTAQYQRWRGMRERK